MMLSVTGALYRVVAVASLAFAGAALHAGVLAGQQRPSLCGGEPQSRWSAAGTVYRPAGIAGNNRSTEFSSITGIAAARGRVFVHDGGVALVFILDDQLQPLTRFGRRGSGPGEFSALPMLAFNPIAHYTSSTIAADDSLLYVYDGRRVQQYRHDGTHVDRSAALPIVAMEHRIRRFAPLRGNLYFGYDSLDLIRGGRRLQTWQLSDSGGALVHAVSLPAPPVGNGSILTWSRDPQPLWAVLGGCIVWADGFNHRLVRTRLSDGVTDTVRLPRHRVPPDDYDHATAARLAQRMGSPPPPPRPRNAPLWHWSGLITDPDGHAWLRPWTRSGRMEGPVYRVDPRGRVHEEGIPAFPEAFGSQGVFYARDRNPLTDELILVRYERAFGEGAGQAMEAR
jgi:hypothetical protein